MTKSISLYKITNVYNNHSYWKAAIRKVNISFFLSPQESNATNIAKDIFFIATEDILKK